MTDEIRTTRLVIVDAAGVDRIVLEAGSGHGSVLVRAATADGTVGVELYAVDPIDADGPEVGVALVVDGDVVDGLRVLARRQR